MKLMTIALVFAVAACGTKSEKTREASAPPAPTVAARESGAASRTAQAAPAAAPTGCYDTCIASGSDADDCGVECFQGHHGEDPPTPSKLPKPLKLADIWPGKKYWVVYVYAGPDTNKKDAAEIALLDRGLTEGIDFGSLGLVLLSDGLKKLGLPFDSEGVVVAFKTEKNARAFAADLPSYTGIAQAAAQSQD